MKKLFTEKPSVESEPKSPTRAEVRQMQKLFAVSSGPKQLSPEALAELTQLFTEKPSILMDFKGNLRDIITSGGIHKMEFLKANALSNWRKVGDIPIESFMLKVMQQGVGAERAPGLVQLGKIFREVGNPPYNVTMHHGDSTEIFARQAFTAIEAARNMNQETDTMRELLESTRRIEKK
jgi:hypothetical protein